MELYLMNYLTNLKTNKIMEPKEKAKELIDKMSFETHKYNAISCSLIAVDEIINVVKRYETKKGKLLIDNINLLYWQEVKQELFKNK